MRLFRLTRNRYGRQVYDRLRDAGLTATWMTEYVREPLPAGDEPPSCPNGSVDVVAPGFVDPLDAPTHELLSDEVVLAAVEDGAPRGYLFLSVDATLEIAPVERSMSFDGGYVRRVFVDPEHRERGFASALVAAACVEARERGATRATALVARDNAPSRQLFERRGFDATRRHLYARVGPFSGLSVRDC